MNELHGLMPTAKVTVRGAAEPQTMPSEYFSLIAPYSPRSFLSAYSLSKLQRVYISGNNSEARGRRMFFPKARQMLRAQAQSPGPAPGAELFLRPPGDTDTFRPAALRYQNSPAALGIQAAGFSSPPSHPSCIRSGTCYQDSSWHCYLRL